jgi:hypothetical protein
MQIAHSRFLNDYLEEGYFDIVVLESDSKELSDFHGTEYESERAIAKKGDRHFSLSGSSKTQFGPKGKRQRSVAPLEISADEYAAAAKGRRIADSNADHEAFSRLKLERDHAARLEKELTENAPRCSVHNKTMQNKLGKKAHFWGCPSYPKCTEVKWMSASEKAICAQLDKLPRPR